MLLLPYLLLFDPVLSHASEVEPQYAAPNAAPRHDYALITLAPRDAPSIPTVTLAPSSVYTQTIANPPTLTGSDLSLVPRSQPTDGVDVYIAPDLQASISSAIKAHCPKYDSPDCQAAVQKVLAPAQQALQKRLLLTAGAVALIAWGAIALVGVIVSALALYGSSHVHIPASDLDQVSSVQGASTIAYVTASNDHSPITIIQTITSVDTASAAKVTIATDSNNGHSMGDLLILVPPNLGAGVAEYISRTDACAGSNLRKRAIDVNCFANIATGVLQMSGEGGPFAGLILATTQWPKNPIAVIAPYLPIVIANGQKIVELATLTSDQINTLAQIACVLTYAQVILHENAKNPTPTQFDLPASDLTSKASSSDACPDPTVAPDCRNCGGNTATTLFCDGIKTAKNFYQHCPCYDATPYSYVAFSNPGAFAHAQSLLKGLTTMNNPPAQPSVVAPPAPTNTGPAIPPQYAPGNGRYTLEITTFQGPFPNNDIRFQVSVADGNNGGGLTLSNVRGTSNALQPLSPGQVLVHIEGDQNTQDQKVQFTMTDAVGTKYGFDMNSYQDYPNVALLSQFYCDKIPPWKTGKPNSRTITCHVQTVAAAPDGWLQLDFYEQMVYETSSLQWTLYTKTWGQKIGQSLAGTVDDKDHAMPGTMTLKVDNPTNTGAFISMEYGGCSFGEDRKNKNDVQYCDKSGPWVPDGAGFNRKLSCYFRGGPPNNAC